jgi:long-chain acyl-CoA synthetase
VRFWSKAESVADRWFKATGSAVAEGYGLSETSPVLTCNPPLTAKWTGTIGLPMPSTEKRTEACRCW